jgi:hypothetical protein
LQYDGTKSEVLQNFKDQGNEMVQSKRWNDAKEFYSRGVAVLTNKVDQHWDEPENQQEEIMKVRLLEEQIFVNRALCNLELSKSAAWGSFNTAYWDRKLSFNHVGLRRRPQGKSQQRQSPLSIGNSSPRSW